MSSGYWHHQRVLSPRRVGPLVPVLEAKVVQIQGLGSRRKQGKDLRATRRDE